MTQQHTDVITKEQHDQIERIKFYNAGVHAAFGQQMGYVYLAGLELNAMKERCKHGEFLKLREAHLPMIPERTARCYMRFQDALAKTATVADLPTVGTLRLTNGQLPENEKDKILKAVHKIADGKTLTELYRDLGVIRDKEEKKHHARKLTAEQKIAAENEQAAAIVDGAEAQMQSVLEDISSDESTLISRIKPSRWKIFLAIGTALNKAVRPLCKRKGASK